MRKPDIWPWSLKYNRERKHQYLLQLRYARKAWFSQHPSFLLAGSDGDSAASGGSSDGGEEGGVAESGAPRRGPSRRSKTAAEESGHMQQRLLRGKASSSPNHHFSQQQVQQILFPLMCRDLIVCSRGFPQTCRLRLLRPPCLSFL